jgi:hypothetical protein
MANAINCNNDVFSAYIHGTDRVETRNFLARQWEKVSDTVRTRGQAFIARARETFEEYDADIIDRSLRSIKRRINNRWGDNEISLMDSIGEFQNANIKTIRWMRANPRIRKAVKGGRCNGWGDLYVDLEPDLWGDKHSDYQRVMNGMAVTDDEGYTTFTTYFGATDEGEEELTYGSQLDIIRNWERLEQFMDANLDDPTDPQNGAL